MPAMELAEEHSQMLMPMMQCRWWEFQMEGSGKLPSLAIARAPSDPYAERVRSIFLGREALLLHVCSV
jgi:hypothetical protein